MIKRLLGQTGVTLTELMVVLSIIAITAAIAMPLFANRLPHHRVKAAARDMISDMRLARSLAVSNNTPYFLCFSPGTGQYQIDQVLDPGGAANCGSANTPTERTVDLKESYSKVVFGYKAGLGSCPNGAPAINSAINFTANRATFNSQGASMTGPASTAGVQAIGIVYLTNTQDPSQETFCVEVEGSTGRARLYRWTGTIWK